MKNFIVIFFISMALKVSGQNNFLGLKVGTNRTNIASYDIFDKDGNRQGFSGGFTYEYFLKKRFSIGADLIYNQRGNRSLFLFIDSNGNTIGKVNISKQHYNYLSLPIKCGLNFGNKFYGFGNIGIIPSILISAKYKEPVANRDGQIIGKTTINMYDKTSKFDIGGIVEIGCGYKHNDNYLLFLSMLYQSSHSKYPRSTYNIPRATLLHNGLSLSIGLKYALSKK